MPTCVSVNSSTDFTTSALAAPDDGFSFAIVQPTPTATAAGPTPSPSATPAPSATPIPTPTPTPSPSVAAACFTVDGSSNNFTSTQLSSPNNGFSFFNNIIANPTPTPTPTAGGLSPGPDCSNAGTWPAYGTGNKYTVTLNDNTTDLWFKVNLANGNKLYAENWSSGTRIYLTVDFSVSGDPIYPCDGLNAVPANFSTLNSMGAGLGTESGRFAIRGNNGTFPLTVDIWVDF